jgi:hypothetical protein
MVTQTNFRICSQSQIFLWINVKTIFCFFLFIFADSLSAEQYDKWIVVTTIQYPTEPVKKLASIPGWRLVVVGDKKTPKDWHLENCDYLDPDKQSKLGYQISELLPWNHYCRKNIGYLYAIQNGAKIIYETDDDNFLTGDVNFLPEECTLDELNCSSSCANIYAYFGQPQVWPRGFPLEKINNAGNFTLRCGVKHWIGIEQGVVNKDPDVDAIYRMTRPSEVYFEKKNSCALPKRVFCPFNSQNTLFHQSAFWGLYIPSTTAFRVCDIWRGYMTQRLLWDANLSLCFTSPTAVQERNYHDFLKDFRDEQDLYLKAGELVTFLLNWKNESPNFVDRIRAITHDMTTAGYYKEKENELMEAWLLDLKKIGYQFPRV